MNQFLPVNQAPQIFVPVSMRIFPNGSGLAFPAPAEFYVVDNGGDIIASCPSEAMARAIMVSINQAAGLL